MDTNKQKTTHTAVADEPASAKSQATAGRNENQRAKAKAPFWKTLFFGLLYAVWGYVAGGALLPFHARPFGIALLCGTDRRVFYVYAGLCVAAWQTEERWILMGVYTATLLLRLLVRFTLDTPWSRSEGEVIGEKTLADVYPYLFSEHLALRMATSCVGAFALGFYRLAEGGFLYYDLYGTLLCTLVAPAAVLLLSGFFTDREVNVYRRMCGFLSLAFLLIWATREQVIYGVSPAAFGCMFVTLYLTRKQGIITGMLAGTVCGLALSPQLAPLFAFAALSFGLLLSVSRFLAVGTAFSVGMAWGVYVNGIGVLGGLLGGLLSASLLFPVLDSLFFSADKSKEMEDSAKPEEVAPTVCKPLPASAMYEIRLADTHHTVKELCESFSSLSDTFFGLSRRMQNPTVTDLRQICDNAFDSSCVSCPDRSRCWGERYHDTEAEIGALCAALHQNGRVEHADAARSLTERCRRLPDILEEINHHASLHKKQILQEDRTEIFAVDYKALSDLLSAAMAKRENEYDPDPALSEALCQALSELQIGVEGAVAWGTKRKRIKLVAQEPRVLTQESDRITEAVRGVCSFPISIRQGSESDSASIEFWEAERLSVLYTQRTVRADGEEEYCGDTTALFPTSDGRFFALISDGMGSGQEAAITSGISSIFLRKLLTSGSSCQVALEMLNGFLRNRVGGGSLHECSATVDLMELDLLRSRASFYKCGAAPTYVFRDGSLFKIRSHTVPIGIIGEPDTRKLGFDVSAGDVVVMVSDGVTQGKEECPWLFDLLRTHAERADPERLADLIVKYAKGEGCSDDISVLIVKLKNHNSGG